MTPTPTHQIRIQRPVMTIDEVTGEFGFRRYLNSVVYKIGPTGFANIMSHIEPYYAGQIEGLVDHTSLQNRDILNKINVLLYPVFPREVIAVFANDELIELRKA